MDTKTRVRWKKSDHPRHPKGQSTGGQFAMKGGQSPKIIVRFKGGPGSGYHGHAGRPGQIGGSASSNDNSGLAPPPPGTKRVYHCFHDKPEDPWDVHLPTMTLDRAHPDERDRLSDFLDEELEYGMTPDVYYAADKPLWGYGPFVQVIDVPDDYIFQGSEPGEYIMPSDKIENYHVFFNPNTDWDTENPGLPVWGKGK